MQYIEEYLTASDGHSIPVKIWRPRNPQALLIIAHGMAEHAGRYAPLADWLNERNIAVVAIEHRGHSDHSPEMELGHFADTDGWNKVVTDLDNVIDYAVGLEPEIPLSLFGHSMGSFIAQEYAQRYGEKLTGMILCGTNRINRPQLMVSKLLVDSIKAFRGPRHLSPLISKMTFGAFNRAFKPNRTSHDWLSRDEAQVDAYLEDAYCGFDCTEQLWSDFIGGMMNINPRRWPSNLPVHVMSGTNDPVGEMGKGIARHIDVIEGAGAQLASVRLFDGARHELINETNALEVWEHLHGCLVTINNK